jgi:hypothetical protein
MNVSLVQRPTEVALGRETVLLDGRQVGYYNGGGKPLLFTIHMDDEEAAAIKSKVEQLRGVTLTKCCIPPPTPPEWIEEAGGADDEEAEY